MKKNFFRVNTDPNELHNALLRALESDFGRGCCNFANLVIVVPNPLAYSTVIDICRKLNDGSPTILPKLTTFTGSRRPIKRQKFTLARRLRFLYSNSFLDLAGFPKQILSRSHINWSICPSSWNHWT